MQGQIAPGFVTLGNWWKQFGNLSNPGANGYVFSDTDYIIYINENSMSLINVFNRVACVNIEYKVNESVTIYSKSNSSQLIEV